MNHVGYAAFGLVLFFVHYDNFELFYEEDMR